MLYYCYGIVCVRLLVCDQPHHAAGHQNRQRAAQHRAVSPMKSLRHWTWVVCRALWSLHARRQQASVTQCLELCPPAQWHTALPRLHGDPDHHIQNEIKHRQNCRYILQTVFKPKTPFYPQNSCGNYTKQHVHLWLQWLKTHLSSFSTPKMISFDGVSQTSHCRAL